MNTTQKIRTRMAPSPTGFMHIGSLRTALYNYLYARQNNGDFILRVEDTDQSRKVDGAIEGLVTMFANMGISYDEGLQSIEGQLQSVGAYGPYVQSERLEIYKEYVQQLVDAGHAYYCFCTAERLDEMRKAQQAAKQPPMYDRTCHGLPAEEVQRRIAAGEPHVVRFLVPKEETITFTDIVRGEITIEAHTIDDQVLLKSDGFPTYHLAVVVDDHLMKISHVIRGEEWLPSTPKHVLLYRAFGWELPEFAHLPLLLNPDRSKLSKRQGDVAVEDYLAKGYLPEALINFVALLGWNPGKGSTQEIFSLEELVKAFQLENVHKAGAVFDVQKLNQVNATYIKALSVDELYERAVPFIQNGLQVPGDSEQGGEAVLWSAEQAGDAELWKRVLTVEQERLETLAGVGRENPFFFVDPYDTANEADLSVTTDLLRWKENTDDQTKEALTKAQGILEGITDDAWTRENLEATLMEAAGDKRGDFLWPLRVALTGAKRSPSPFDCAWVLGRAESLERVGKALKLYS